MSTETTVAQLQNWNNFCQYHANNDWYGTWTRYSADGQILETFHCIRSFYVIDNGNEIHHQNYYTYADGTKETKTFGPYKKPITRGLFLDNTFSWGSTKVESGSNFGFETGLRYEDKRASVFIGWDDAGNLERITVIPETLTIFPENASPPSAKELSGNWVGTAKNMTPNWMVSSPVPASWKPLENLADDYQIFHFSDGISISCPRKVAIGQSFLAAIEWQIYHNLLQRGIRNYKDSSLTNFTLQTFSLATE
ncbi:hypothetical protein WA1_12400 [Scytonema hofmannii PCC 7110]|uniref:Uncharacterized protein n=1 Tax=Scytonema hofmannii PCC 7110 TaxID=128403 RepID=A0A139XDY6_9CYAN|nr:DUF3598 family protein [Scytonema hofmannii]KYC42911.1 hypothetical protein WA1_12400 [Scytonema hofmannii PCC 7110]